MVVKEATKVEEATVVARVAIAEAMAAKVATTKATAAVKAATAVAKVRSDYSAVYYPVDRDGTLPRMIISLTDVP